MFERKIHHGVRHKYSLQQHSGMVQETPCVFLSFLCQFLLPNLLAEDGIIELLYCIQPTKYSAGTITFLLRKINFEFLWRMDGSPGRKLSTVLCRWLCRDVKVSLETFPKSFHLSMIESTPAVVLSQEPGEVVVFLSSNLTQSLSWGSSLC